MTQFWMLALLMSVAAVAFVLLPALVRKQQEPSEEEGRKDLNVSIFSERLAEYDDALAAGDLSEAEHQALVTELKKTVLSENDPGAADQNSGSVQAPQKATGIGKLPFAAALFVPVFAVLAYSDFGFSWGSMDDVLLAKELNTADPHNTTELRTTINKLAERLKTQPDNHEGWYTLGRSYLNLENYGGAARAFNHLLKTFPDDHNINAFYAEALYLSEGQRMTPRVEEALDRTLSLNPHDITMLEIKALGTYTNGNPRGAIELFNKAIAAGAPPERAAMINRAIARIQEDLTDAGEEAVVADSAEPDTAADVRRLMVRVEVADSVDVGANTPVFIFARAINGPPMPLAVQRMVRGALPTTVELNESMAMMAGMGLANFDQVQVVARISSSGIANVSPDDFQAVSGTIDLTSPTDVINLRIESRVKDQNGD